ncbi:alpha/beta fold hydrolase [Nitrincola iocasae]|uniref:Alpha/beta hydrolase n=1 Tax=Nitrincola iocasae TaxID=2614693 RepID=A0A5J6LDK6_9GAMM|nr:alpha/beta hydrolase [Nitrincola iocasae]QEW06446.1 alpha/beta hydrolase [Nitrincola iocasae]
MSINGTLIEDRFIEVPGGQIFVRQWQPSQIQSCAPVIMLHDSLGSVAQWRNFPLQLSEQIKRPVIAYDRLGFGLSSARHALPSENFIVEEAEVIFPALCQAMGITRFGLLGHSVGGVMALTIAAFQNEACEATITLAAQAFVEERTLEGIRAAQQQFAETANFNKLKKWHGEKARWVLDAWTGSWLSSAFRDWRIDPWLSHINSAVLVIHGDSDEYGSIAFPRHIAAGVNGRVEQAILQQCGHLPHAEQPEKVLDVIADFIQPPASTPIH